MTRQHCTPVLLTGEAGLPLTPLSQLAGEQAVSEADIQALVHTYAHVLPIAEIDPMFVGAVPICRELNTSAGPIDNVLVTPSGLPVLVECKLWRNPEGRREVVGQILDYAKELSRWSSSDFQREVSRRLKSPGNPLLDLIRASDPSVDEVQFNDALTSNLRRGRFLLLIVGDGIREGVEAIAEYLQRHAGLHFTLGLVELPIFLLPGGQRLVVPRVLARTTLITRTVVAVPEGYRLQADEDEGAESEIDPDHAALINQQQQFWSEFLDYVSLDDPEQIVPKAPRMGYITFSMPAPNGSSWLTVYRDQRVNEVGVFLSAHRNTAGDYAMRAIADDWTAVKIELGGDAELTTNRYGQPRMISKFSFGSLDDPRNKQIALRWLADRVNTFVNVMRPRVRSAVADFQAREPVAP